jgi:hypothetical protein
MIVDAAERLDLPYFVVHVRGGEEGAPFEPPDEVPAGHALSFEAGGERPEEKSSIVVDRMIALSER